MPTSFLTLKKLVLVFGILVAGVVVIIVLILRPSMNESNHNKMLEREKATIAWLMKLPVENPDRLPLNHPRRKSMQEFTSWDDWAREGQNIPGAEEVLIRLLKGEIKAEWVFPSDVAMGLECVGGKKSVPALIDALSSNNPNLRTMAALALGKIGDSKAFEPVSALLHDSDPNVRANVCTAIAKLDPKRAKKMLIQALNDESDFVRESAKKELRILKKKE